MADECDEVIVLKVYHEVTVLRVYDELTAQIEVLRGEGKSVSLHVWPSPLPRLCEGRMQSRWDSMFETC